MKVVLLLLVCLSVVLAQTPRERAKELLSKMSLDQKLAMVHGYGGPYVGNVNPIPELKIPALTLEDGPQGVADGVHLTTCWPSALSVVTTWDVDLMYTWGRALAAEQKMKGTNIMLGPMINIARVPVGGRNFESFGEDPTLSSRMVEASVKGIQSQGIMACAKHYVDNNQETNRTTTNANIDERTQHEIYYPAFKAAADAKAASFMCSYNIVNGFWACENNATLNNVLKNMWGYEGFVMSDWGATHSTVLAANSGLDMQMPDASHFGAALKQAVQAGQVPVATIDDKVLRILQSMFQVGLFDRAPAGNLNVDSRSQGHNLLARTISAQATVLLKNVGNVLPLSPTKKYTIAVIGDDGDKNPTVAGDGSGHVIASYIVTPLDGIKKRVGADVTVKYASSTPVDIAVHLAKSADVAIVFVATKSSEGSDRRNLELPGNQDALVAAVANVQPNTIVVLHTPGAVTMPWVNSVKAILYAGMPGQEDGNAIADVLFGDVNPAAKLPVTFPVSDSQTPLKTTMQYPGVNNQAYYTEKLLVGYRWYDNEKETPLFPFGHGLSYTTFGYGNLQIQNLGNHVSVSFTVQNTGHVDGAEVSQLYVGYPAAAGEPPKVLRHFGKVFLKAGQSHQHRFNIDYKAGEELSIWDATAHNWKAITGQFTIFVGSSSRDIRLQGTVNI